jgi:hypothetical protein
MAEQLDPRLEAIVDYAAEAMDERRLALCGGGVLDTLLDKPVKDYDIIIEEPSPAPERAAQVADNLVRNGFDVPVRDRLFYAWIDRPVTLVEATKGDKVLDIAFMPYDMIRYFTIDSMYVTYPDKKIVDDFDAMGAYQRQEIQLARGIEEENPFLTAARALNISAKYDIPLRNAWPLLDELAERMWEWTPPHDFHLEARDLAAADALKAIVRSTDQREFAEDVLENSVLTHLFPEIESALTQLVDQREVWHYTSKNDLVADLLPLIRASHRPTFLSRLGSAAVQGGKL